MAKNWTCKEKTSTPTPPGRCTFKADVQTYMSRHIYTYIKIHRHTDRQIKSQRADNKAVRQTDTQTERQTDRRAARQTDFEIFASTVLFVSYTSRHRGRQVGDRQEGRQKGTPEYGHAGRN